MKPKLGEAVEVSWVDSCGGHGWDEPKRAVEAEPCDVRSVGYLMADTPKHVTIVQNIDLTNDNLDHFMCIPRVAVTKIRRLA